MKDEKAGEELERMWKKWPWPNLKYYPGIYLEGIRKNMKNLCKDSRSPGQDLNPETPEYEVGMHNLYPAYNIPSVRRTENEIRYHLCKCTAIPWHTGRPTAMTFTKISFSNIFLGIKYDACYIRYTSHEYINCLKTLSRLMKQTRSHTLYHITVILILPTDKVYRLSRSKEFQT
jgi:hypothetical protein